MSLIKNLINDDDNRKQSDEDNDEKKPMFTIKNATDLQRIKLERLMKNPEKEVYIPETRKEKDYLSSVPSFVRNVMGSSAGAGSGEFHVYRHLRRKEYARQKTIQMKSQQELLDEEFQQKLEQNRLEAESKTAKKRAKRLKKKERSKRLRKEEAKSIKGGNQQESCGISDDDVSESGADLPESIVEESAMPAESIAESAVPDEFTETIEKEQTNVSE